MLDTFVIYAHPIDDGPVRWQPEQARLWISILGLGCQRTDFHETKSKVCKVVIMFSVLVKTTCESNRVWEIDAENLFFKGWGLLFIQHSDY